MITPQSSCIQPPHIWFPWLSGIARRWSLEPLIRLPEPWFLEGNEHWHGKLMGTSRDRKIKGNREEMMGLTCFFFGAFNGKICKNHVKSSINAGVSIGTLMILMTGGATGLCKAAFPPGTWLPSVPRPLFKRCQKLCFQDGNLRIFEDLYLIFPGFQGILYDLGLQNMHAVVAFRGCAVLGGHGLLLHHSHLDHLVHLDTASSACWWVIWIGHIETNGCSWKMAHL